MTDPTERATFIAYPANYTTGRSTADSTRQTIASPDVPLAAHRSVAPAQDADEITDRLDGIAGAGGMAGLISGNARPTDGANG